MAEQPLISIITVNRDNLAGLQRTVDSVLQQTWKAYEYIVIDGNSTDGSAEFLKSRDSEIDKWVSELDTGIYNAMNKGIRMATGEYLLFLNSGDELYHSKVFENNYKYLGTEDIIYFDIFLIFENESKVHKYPEELNFSTFRDGAIGHPSSFIKRELFKKVGFYDENLKIVADWKFFFLAVVKCKCSFIKVDQVLSKFYMDGISSTKTNIVKKEREKVLGENFKYHERIYRLEYTISGIKKIFLSRTKPFLRPIKKAILNSFRFFITRNLEYIDLKAKVNFYKTFKKSVPVKKDDAKTYPIIIISFNQLFYLKKLINKLLDWDYRNIIIIDNNSTYQPLIQYFNEIKEDVTIFRLKKNYGHGVFWKKKEFMHLYGQTYYAITDPDVVPDDSCPEDFMEYFRTTLEKNPDVTKVGFSLKLDDIPHSNPHRSKILNWENKFWQNMDENANYKADIDTTFALYRPKSSFGNKNEFLKAIRTKPPYRASHGGWYIDVNSLTEEQKNYMETANDSSSWRIDKKGELINPDYK